ncbi:MAG: prepilin-type N-terminal cleavage/methylation domain-containing protein [Planctomycetota bacterium]
MTRQLRTGFTLLELAIALTLSVVLLGAGSFLANRCTALLYTEMDLLALDGTGHRVLEHFVNELRVAASETIVPAILDDASSVQYRQVSGYAKGKRQLSPARSIEFRRDDGEAPNGKDDDGDGLVDEGSIVQVAGGSEVTLCSIATRCSLTGTETGIVVSIDLATVDATGRVAARSFSHELSFRN